MLIDRLNISIKNTLEKYNARLFKSSNSYILNNPSMLYYSKMQIFNNLYDKLNKNIEQLISNKNIVLNQLKTSYVLTNPEIIYKYKNQELTSIIEKLEVLNPLNTLKRGYTITKINNKVISSINDIKKDDNLEIEFRDGKVNAVVKKVGE